MAQKGMGSGAADLLPVVQPGASSGQYSLIYRRALTEMRLKRQTADCVCLAEVDDGQQYYLKMDVGDKQIRASEWLGTLLGESIGIAAPSASAIQRMDGDLAFGSRALGGIADQAKTTAYLLRETLQGNQPSSLARILSSIYAYDLFINNEDRHFGNYLTVQDGGVSRLYAFDYSKAFFWDWPWSGFPMIKTRTRDCGTELRKRHGFDLEAANEMLVRLSNVSPAMIQSFLTTMPESWLSAAKRQAFQQMWAGPHRLERIAQIKDGVARGWLL